MADSWAGARAADEGWVLEEVEGTGRRGIRTCRRPLLTRGTSPSSRFPTRALTLFHS